MRTRMITIGVLVLVLLGAGYVTFVVVLLPWWLATPSEVTVLLDDDPIERLVWREKDATLREIDLRGGSLKVSIKYRGEQFEIRRWQLGSEMEDVSKQIPVTDDSRLTPMFRLIRTSTAGLVAIADSARICVFHRSEDRFADRELAREFVAGIRLVPESDRGSTNHLPALGTDLRRNATGESPE